MNKKLSRLRRGRQTRLKIAELRATRLTVTRSNSHIYATVIDETGSRVIATASTLEASVRASLSGNGGNTGAATLVGKLIAEKALKAGVTNVAFDRAGYRYHGRVKALAEAAREAGLKF
jgi:large subunit ribosomal protein L18